MLALSVVLFFVVTNGHMRLIWPEPRNTAAGLNDGPCGPDDFGTGAVTAMEPGPTTILVEPQNPHANYNYRVAISQEGEDTYDCILIDHVPQILESGIAELWINVTIPDVECDPCALQVIMVSAPTECCVLGSNDLPCGTTYYSCADITINGQEDRDELECEPPCEWSYRDEMPGTYYAQSSDELWLQVSGDQLELNVTGPWMQPRCSNVTEPSVCDTGKSGGGGKNNKDSSTSLASGGTMDAGGVVALILAIILLIVIGLTYYFKVHNKPDTSNDGVIISSASSLQIGNNQQIEPVVERAQPPPAPSKPIITPPPVPPHVVAVAPEPEAPQYDAQVYEAEPAEIYEPQQEYQQEHNPYQ